MKNQYQELNTALLAFNKLQSENYDGQAHDLQPAQERIRELLTGMEKRRGLVRLDIECQPEVRFLRNKLDDYSNYGSSAIKSGELAMRMRPDVLELMKRRNAAAVKLGYSGYAAAILEADGLHTDWLDKKLNVYLDRHLPNAAKRAAAAKISIDDWYPWISRESVLEQTYSPMTLLNDFAHRLGLENVIPKLDIRMEDSFCYASQSDAEHIVMQISPVCDVSSWTTLFHEFGHACVYANLPGNALPFLSSLVDETIAVLFENAAVRILARDPFRSQAISMLHTEYTRTCISGLFELDLWRDSGNPEALYEHWYYRLGVSVDAYKWAADSFRSIDCMTIFAYTIGQLLADSVSDEKLIRLLPGLAEGAADMTLYDLVEKCGALN